MKTLPIPTQVLDKWDLPGDWGNHVTIQISGGDRTRGNGDAVVLAYQMGATAPWMFSVRTDWLPVRCRTQATVLTQLTLDEFKQALELKVEQGVSV